MFLVLPGICQSGEAGLEEGQSILNVLVKAVEIVGESPDLGGIHDGLRHGSVVCWRQAADCPTLCARPGAGGVVVGLGTAAVGGTVSEVGARAKGNSEMGDGGWEVGRRGLLRRGQDWWIDGGRQGASGCDTDEKGVHESA